MNTTPARLLVTLLLVLLCGVTAVAKKGGNRGVATLSKPAAEAVTAKFPKATVTRIRQRGSDSNPWYEVRLQNDSQEYKLEVTPAGKIVQVARDIPADKLPKPVLDAVRARLPSSMIADAAEICVDGQVARYELEVIASDKSLVDLVLDPDGRPVAER